MAKLQYRTISKRTVGKLPVAEKEAVYWDRELLGFGVRVYPNGTKVYVVQTRAGGKSKRIAVGRHGVISPDQARRKVAQMIVRIKAGEDPNPEATKKPSGPTVAELAERYLVEHVQVRCKPRTGVQLSDSPRGGGPTLVAPQSRVPRLHPRPTPSGQSRPRA